MAETSAVPQDGLAHPDQDGSVDTGGRRAYVWCQDDTTGHRYDVPATRLPMPGVTPINRYPLNFRALARHPKPLAVWESDPSEPADPANPAPADPSTPAAAESSSAVAVSSSNRAARTSTPKAE